MKKLLFFLLFLFMTITSTMAQQDVCSVVRTIMNEAKGLVNKGKNADALALLRAAQAQPELRSCVDYGLLSEEIERIETNQYLVIPVNDSISITMIKVEGGTFMMGATEEQGDDAKEDEYPVHQVTLSDYYIAQEQVTVDLWDALMTPKPDMRKYSSFAVMIYWYECNSFIRKLNQLTGRKFRLLTEAEWEYAARGGKKSKGHKKAPSPNELGIYGMSNYIADYCSDIYGKYSSMSQNNPKGYTGSSDQRVTRGGTFNRNRVSARNGIFMNSANSWTGFRLAM
jgi:formylglycine-generating enzyme required for sulfatase activity